MFSTYKDFLVLKGIRFESGKLIRSKEFCIQWNKLMKKESSLELYALNKRVKVESIGFWKSTGNLIKNSASLKQIK